MTSEQQSPLQPLLRKLQQWRELDLMDQEAVLGLPFRLELLERGQYIVREDDKPSHSCLIVSGFAYRHKIVADGGRSINAIHMRGDMVDLQNSLLRLADHNVQALTQCKVAFIPRDSLIELAFAHPAVGMAMWYDTLVDGSIFREWIANIGRRNSAARIAHVLCEFAIRAETAGLGDRTHYELPMSQEQLADATGLTPVHVNRTLQALRSGGAIDRTKRSVALADWDKISGIADFRTNYLHLPQ